MTWRDNLQEASFRGASFYVDSHTGGVGRRNVVRQFPYRNGTSVSDLGLDADEYQIEGYVIADGNNDLDYFPARNALINALKKYGAGTLIHPFLGEVRVVVSDKATWSERYSEGGIAKFSMSFVTAGKNDYPELDTDPIGATDDAADDVSDGAIDEYADQVDTDDIPSWSLNTLYEDFVKFTNMANAYVSRIRNSGGQPLRDFKDTIDSARSLVVDSLQIPCQFGSLVLDIYDSILAMVNVLGPGYATQVLGDCSNRLIKEINSSSGDVIDNGVGLSMIDSLCDIAGDSDTTGYGSTEDNITNAIFDEINITTYDRARQAANRLALVNFIKSIAISTASKVAIRTTYLSLQEMWDRLYRITDSIDYLLLKIGDESASDQFSDYGIYTDNRILFNSLEQLRSVFIVSMREKSFGLAQEFEYEPQPDGVSALQLAYDKYLDLDRMDEIFVRNRDDQQHPGMLVGTLNILSE